MTVLRIWVLDNETIYLRAKVCFPLFGLPTDSNANTLLDGYTPEQQKEAATFVDKICELYPLKKQATVEVRECLNLFQLSKVLVLEDHQQFATDLKQYLIFF